MLAMQDKYGCSLGSPQAPVFLLLASSSKAPHGAGWLLEVCMGWKREEKQQGRKKPFPNESAPFKQPSKKSQIMLPPTSSHWLESVHLAAFGWEV